MHKGETDKIWDCTVIGAGIEGSNAARYSALLGKNTLCLEQFPCPHDRGSSHGQSRIIRHSHQEPHLARMMPEAFKLWEEIEQLAKTKLFINCGFLYLDDFPCTKMKTILANLKANNIASELLNAKQLKEKYNFNFSESVKGLLEETGGILLASKCLQAIQFFLCPWAPALLKLLGDDIPLRPKHITVCYWKVKDGFDAENDYPAWSCKNLTSSDHQGSIYSSPCYEYPGMIKVCYGYGPDVDPDSRDDVDVTWTVDITAEFVERHLIGVECRPSIVEQCIYTPTPDKTCILDKHPRFKNIILGVGFSGYGFKLAPVYGKILCELAFDLDHSFDLRPFRVGRLRNHAPKSSL